MGQTGKERRELPHVYLGFSQEQASGLLHYRTGNVGFSWQPGIGDEPSPGRWRLCSNPGFATSQLCGLGEGT